MSKRKKAGPSERHFKRGFKIGKLKGYMQGLERALTYSRHIQWVTKVDEEFQWAKHQYDALRVKRWKRR